LPPPRPGPTTRPRPHRPAPSCRPPSRTGPAAELVVRRIHDVERSVFLPTYGSWLNRIEPEFAAPRYFALNGTDQRSHPEQNTAIAAYVRWHNAQAGPKTDFAPDSPIRTWTEYPAKAA
jgi:hypothetical protein